MAEELPIRLAHRVKELDNLPHNLNKMASIEKVKKWYAESFEVRPPEDASCLARARARDAHLFGRRSQELVTFPRPELPPAIHDAFVRASHDVPSLPEAIPNPSLPEHMKARQTSVIMGRQRMPLQHRWVGFAPCGDAPGWTWSLPSSDGM